MRKISLFIACLSLVAFSAPEAQAASPKAGASCTNLNQTFKAKSANLICLKSGRKLIWRVKSAPATTNPGGATSGSKFITPLAPAGSNPITWTNIEARFSEISEITWKSAQETIVANSGGQNNSSVKVIYAPNTATSHYSGFENYLKTGIRLWNRFQLPPNVTFLVFSYDEIPWAEGTINKILADSGMQKNDALAQAKNLAHAPYGGPDCGGANAGMVSDTQAIGVFALCARNEGSDPYYQGSLQIHEFTHQMQGAQFIKTNLNNQQILPCWISEGLAHVGGISAGTSNFNDYLRVRNLQVSHPQLNVAGGHSSDEFPLSSMTYEYLKKYYAESAPPGCFELPSYSLGYSAGFLTTEALAAIGGVESTLLLYTRTGKGETFEAAFKNIYGIDWKSAQDILAKVISKEFKAL